jgi:hypothetical protein
MEPATFLLSAAGIVILALAEHNRRLSREIKRNDETIADLRVANHEYENKILEYKSDLKQMQSECTEANESAAKFKKEAFRAQTAADKERLKVQIRASETNTTVWGEADAAQAAERFARAALRIEYPEVKNSKSPEPLDLDQIRSALMTDEEFKAKNAASLTKCKQDKQQF